MYSSIKTAFFALALVAGRAQVEAATSYAHGSPFAHSLAGSPLSTSRSSQRAAGHPFKFVNKCGAAVTPVIADTSCGYSPRCADAAKYSGPAPKTLASGASQTLTIDSAWVGRIFASHPACGPKGESCTITEYNLDSGDAFTPQTYDISNIQGFTNSVQIAAAGCDTVTCTSPSCGCRSAYPLGDLSGCGNDSPVHACGAGNIAFTVTFCP
ncbi:hypothetical protein B0H13DRAFT_1090261 [Mycena leptocephala]|nr:hypothetical protein B0H13DRAFT_1090261 [Mycena leptocephala]